MRDLSTCVGGGAYPRGVASVVAEQLVEARYLPAPSPGLDHLEAIRAAAEAHGVSAAVAAGLVGWLAAGAGDVVSKATRTRYRAVLRELEEAGAISGR